MKYRNEDIKNLQRKVGGMCKLEEKNIRTIS